MRVNLLSFIYIRLLMIQILFYSQVKIQAVVCFCSVHICVFKCMNDHCTLFILFVIPLQLVFEAAKEALSWRIQRQFKVRPSHDYVDSDRNIK